ncbi:non-ribosomal peptide synthetase [Puia dinghuensis]|uniref:non-ribosomal peptide synthetase n=1 Tax=Puia dinghuensis TaxID=1792502 RepID=UPI0021D30821|nr:non-ribosomal peptide synthetase [Puia dinghuensis]
MVVAREDKEGNKRLVGYIVGEAGWDREQLMTQLKERLPEYMVPMVWVELEAMPLTANGKVDRKGLPDPETNGLTSDRYIAARSEVEHQLTQIWSELLGVEQVGVTDNFFELGGDSIIAIQVVARTRRLGYERLQVADLFTYQTIGKLCAMLAQGSDEGVGEAGERHELEGISGLLPIQRWYLEGEPEAVSHYNQSVLLRIAKEVREEELGAVVEWLLRQHDALRFEYRRGASGWEQVYGPMRDIGAVLRVEELRGGTAEELGREIEVRSEGYQRSLNIGRGELVRVVLYRTPEWEEWNRLLVVIHHLVVDGVSWRILLGDLEELLTGLRKGEAVSLGVKRSSYREWYGALEWYSRSKGLLEQKGYWSKVMGSYRPLQVDREYAGMVRLGEMGSHTIRLGAEPTRWLLQEVPRVYHTEVNDVLLSALLLAIGEWSGEWKVMIGLEGHGREAIKGGVDTSRTVGWFTSVYPVLLEGEEGAGLGEVLKGVKEQLRGVPDKGLGYGVLKYMVGAEELQRESGWDIVFNYLGQVDNVVRGSRWLRGAEEPTGRRAAERNGAREKVSVVGMVAGGELVLRWGYSKKHYDGESIEELSGLYVKKLEELIDHCRGRDGQEHTPSDYGLGREINYVELDRFFGEQRQGKRRGEQVEGLYRLSGLQEGMLFHGLYDEQAGTYVIQLEGELLRLDEAIFRRSWSTVVRRHSILRSGFYHDAFKIPVQCVYREVEVPVEVLDYRGRSEAEQREGMAAYKETDRRRGFAFGEAPLMRVGLLRLSEERCWMLWTHHHLLLDGWSVQVLMEEFLKVYEELVSGGEVKKEEEDRYEEYIRYLEGRDKEEEESYWRKYLSGVSGRTLLPFVREGVERNKGIGKYAQWEVRLGKEETDRVVAYAQGHRLTVNTVMQGVWGYLLSRYTGSEEVVYGVTVSGRPEGLRGVERRVGLYINMLPVRVVVKGEEVVEELLLGLQEEQLRSREYQYSPLQEVQGWAWVTGDWFDSILVFENYPVSEVIGKRKWSLGVEGVKMHDRINYPLGVTIGVGEQIAVTFRYNVELLEEEVVKRIGSHFERVLQQVTDGEVKRVRELELMGEEEVRWLLEASRGKEAEYDRDKTVVELFEDQADRLPDRTAVFSAEGSLSYRELDLRSNQLAQYLVSRGVRPGEHIGLLFHKSVEMVAGIWGILKSGCAYVPLNTDYPAQRIRFMVEDAGISRVVYGSGELYAGMELGELVEGIDFSVSCSSPLERPFVDIGPASTVYVMYTSGTTGQPKGTAVDHHNIIKLVYDGGPIAIQSGDRVLQWSNYSFDGSVYDIFCSLLSGASVYMIRDGMASDTHELSRIIEEQSITVCFMTTALFNAFVDTGAGALCRLRKLLFGGELFSLTHVRKAVSLLGVGRIVHVYGPTETTVYATGYAVDAIEEEGRVPIGRPLGNTRVRVLDERLQPVPVGVTGELFIGGEGVSKGYLNWPELTAERFIADPWEGEGGGRIYRTGDIGRWLPDGNIEFIGRKDDQVKIRGYRVELGEVESVLGQCTGIRQCAVVAREDQKGNKRLVGYVVVEGKGLDRLGLMRYLGQRLPEYMVPAIWVELETLPLTVNGKVDRKRLPEPKVGGMSGGYEAPRDEVERQLAGIWSELLGVEQVGVTDNFFELGGDSIISIQVVSRARRLNYELQPKDIFRYQSISHLSMVLLERTGVRTGGEQGELEGISGLLPIQRWYLEGEPEEVSHYNQSVLLRIAREVSQEELGAAVEELLRHHDSLRFQYRRGVTGWEQVYGPMQDIGAVLRVEELSGSTAEELGREIEERSEGYQRSLAIGRGELVRVVLYRTPEWEEWNRLLVVIHHLVVDGVSWRILLGDLEELLTGLRKGEQVSLGVKGSSYREWYGALEGYSRSKRLLEQKGYWSKVMGSYRPLRLDREYAGMVRLREMGSHTVRLGVEQTRWLLQEVPRVYHTEVNDVLLSALLLAIGDWGGERRVVIGLEGHGREAIKGGVDTSRTVGWFTSVYPVLLEREEAVGLGEVLKGVKEQLRGVPDKGLGYGVLKYMVRAEELQGETGWDIVFNYLGQVDNVVSGSRWIRGAGESGGRGMSERQEIREKVSVVGIVAEGELVVRWGYSRKHYDGENIERLSGLYAKKLQELIDHCRSREGQEHTPSDYGLGREISYKELDRFLDKDAGMRTILEF